MQRVFANKQLAVDSLQDYANEFQTPCVVYCATYGPHRTPEYTIRPTCDVIDLSSPCVVATTVHVIRPGQKKYVPELLEP